jgi:hypothetical protein
VLRANATQGSTEVKLTCVLDGGTVLERDSEAEAHGSQRDERIGRS